MSIENERFKLMRACPPPLEGGQYTVSSVQTVTSPASDSFSEDMTFSVKGARFTIAPDEVYSVYPPVNASGNYSDSIGHITLKNKSLPWENNICGEFAKLEALTPWLALICVSESEEQQLSELTVGDLLKTSQTNPDIFFPQTKLPSCTEKPDDICKALDLSVSLFEGIMPRQNELHLLTHVKSVDLYEKCDEIVSMDGCFSVVVSNRFLSSGSDSFQKSSLHLVSLEGFDGYLPEGEKFEEIKKCKEYKKIRLASLYSWNVFSITSGSADFKETAEKINSAPLAIDSHPILKRGHIPLKHHLRSGETTVSIYRGPLAPYRIEKKPDSDKLTADGRVIYDPINGVFDMSYAAAWQLGRLIVLKNKTIASAILRWRRDSESSVRKRSNKVFLQNKMHTFTKQDGIEDFCAQELCAELTENDLIAPVAKDTRGRDKKPREVLSHKAVK